VAGVEGLPPGLLRLRLLSEASDVGLRNIINDLFREKSSFQDGGTASAVAYERATGQPVGGDSIVKRQKSMLKHWRKLSTPAVL